MFTGIIQDVGKIISLDSKNNDTLISVQTNLSLNKIHLGDSISCSGVCLTVVAINKNIFKAELSQETLNITSAKNWKIGTKLNLEFSLLVGDQIGGHIVSGHVDGLSVLKRKEKIKGSYKLDFKVPKKFIKFIVNKGSISIDGVSLTVNKIKENTFSVNIIAHTLQNTTLGFLNINDKVNIEVDTMARYAVKLAENYMKRITNGK